MTTPAPDALLRDRLASDPGSAFVTAYDDVTGERLELSATTFANWVAKTSNLAVDELDLTSGDRVVIDLPLHWQTLVWMHACWAVGAVVVLEPADGATDVTVAVTTHAHAEDGSDAIHGLGARDVVSLALLPLARPQPEAVAGAIDYDREVPMHGDVFVGAPLDVDAQALVHGGRAWTHRELVEQVRERLAAEPLAPDARLAVVEHQQPLVDAMTAALLVPLLNGGGVVLQKAPVPQAWQARLDQERATQWPTPVEVSGS